MSAIIQPVLDPVTVTAPVASITLPLALYLCAWAIGAVLIVWAVARVLKAREPDGSPTLFWWMTQTPKQELLLWIGVSMIILTTVVVVWKLATNTDMPPFFEWWLGFTFGVVGLSPTTTLIKWSKWKKEAAEMDAAQSAGGAP